MVAGLAGQSVEAQRGNGTHQAAFGLCVPNGQGYADSADGHRAELGTRYTVDTLKKLVRRYPKRRFIWIMGALNLLHFHHWRQWRDIARLMPIAVLDRPGYDKAAHATVAMCWLGRFVRPATHNPQLPDSTTPAP